MRISNRVLFFILLLVNGLAVNTIKAGDNEENNNENGKKQKTYLTAKNIALAAGICFIAYQVYDKRVGFGQTSEIFKQCGGRLCEVTWNAGRKSVERISAILYDNFCNTPYQVGKAGWVFVQAIKLNSLNVDAQRIIANAASINNVIFAPRNPQFLKQIHVSIVKLNGMSEDSLGSLSKWYNSLHQRTGLAISEAEKALLTFSRMEPHSVDTRTVRQ